MPVLTLNLFLFRHPNSKLLPPEALTKEEEVEMNVCLICHWKAAGRKALYRHKGHHIREAIAQSMGKKVNAFIKMLDQDTDSR